MIISIGKSRKDIRWHNTDISWSEFIEKLKEPHRTHETVREYKSMSKDEQGRAKDIGGFVGGALSSGRRKSANVLNRSMVTLDLDDAAPQAWSDAAVWGWTMAMYSTHSHTPERPRMRMVFPLDRTVSVDEYQAIARRIGEYIGIEQLDPSTHEPSRLFYWPSCPSDGEYVFKAQDGEVICADEILSTYGLDDAWKDSRLWPTAKNEAVVRVTEAKKQGDPTEKQGIVGLFCRTYDIHDAIAKFLPEVYAEGTAGRYTFLGGSTADGAVIYEDGLFLYSHHGTDPCGGQLVNAFDLVRIHLFGELDDKNDEDVEITKRPSYKRMSEFAAEDDAVKQMLAEEAAAKADAAFGDLLGEEAKPADEYDPDWAKKLQVDKKGIFTPTSENIRLIVLNDERLRGKIRYNEFTRQLHATGALPWRRDPHIWEDGDDAGLRWYVEKFWNITSRNAVADALELVKQSTKYHPVREYLNSLEWDGVERLDEMLIHYLEADDTPFTRAVTRKWMVGACKRVFEPGCKFDTMLVVVSPTQGAGKSMLGDTLAGEWFKDGLKNLEGKDAMQELQGKWIIEMGEMAATKKSTNEVIKQFISCRIDSYRASYGHYSVDRPRQCVFIGSTNNREFILDETGGRRFWPVESHADIETSVARIDRLARDRDQLWAEAMHRYKSGEKVWMDDSALMRDALSEQERFTQQDEWHGMVADYLDTPLPDAWDEMDADQRRDYIQKTDLRTDAERAGYTRLRDVVSIAEIRYELLREDLVKGAGGNNESSRHLGRVMNVMTGWELARSPRKTPFGKQKVFVRKGSSADARGRALRVGNKAMGRDG